MKGKHCHDRNFLSKFSQSHKAGACTLVPSHHYYALFPPTHWAPLAPALPSVTLHASAARKPKRGLKPPRFLWRSFLVR